jgi:hypothetical protein
MAAKRDQRPYNVAYYGRHRAEEISRVTGRQRVTLEFLREVRRRPCADCGGVFSPWVMDFDHRDPAKKSFNVMSGRARLMSRSRLIAEIDKCDIVCANCHAARTYRWLLALDRPLTGRPADSRRNDAIGEGTLSYWNNFEMSRAQAAASAFRPM